MKGVLLFAFNNDIVDYYNMAIETAKRVNYFLNLPVSVVTDSSTNINEYSYKFDNVILANKDTSNKKDNNVWINKGRYRAYDLSPYDETIVLDTDYLINTNNLNKIFDLYDDFMVHNTTNFLLEPNHVQEQLSKESFPTLWATLIAFKKTNKTKQIFECLQMVQENYMHYVSLYNIPSTMYRNDYGLTIATRIVYNHLVDNNNYIPWDLAHVNNHIKVYKNTNNSYNTSYTLINESGKRPEYIEVKDYDFHCMNKTTFMELV